MVEKIITKTAKRHQIYFPKKEDRMSVFVENLLQALALVIAFSLLLLFLKWMGY